MYEPAMRHLLDTYIRAEESEELSTFDDLTLVELIVERGDAALDALPEDIRKNPEAVAETIENNVRRLIIDEMAVNPRYYEKMSELLDALIHQRKQEAIDYKDYLSRIVELTREVSNPQTQASYPSSIDNPPGGRVRIAAPLHLNDDAVRLAVISRIGWIPCSGAWYIQ